MGWSFPSPWDLPNPEIEPRSLALQTDFLLTEPLPSVLIREAEGDFEQKRTGQCDLRGRAWRGVVINQGVLAVRS